MTNPRSTDGVLDRHREAMGHELGTLYNNLWSELVWLHIKWGEYVRIVNSSSVFSTTGK